MDGKDEQSKESSDKSVMDDCLEMPCLGRPFGLGSLYDCRTECLIPGLSFWTQENLENTQTIPKTWSNGYILSEDNFESKTSSMRISATLSLSCMSGMVQVSGAAEYLNDKKNSLNKTRLTLSYQCTSRVEALTMKHITQLDFKEDVFRNSEPTHVVAAVLYGANAYLVFEKDREENEEKMNVKGSLEAAVKKGVDISGKAAVDIKNDEKKFFDKIDCKFYGDFQPEKNPVTYDDAMVLWQNLPKFLKHENGNEKHVPIRVWLYPISKLCSRATKLQLSISLDLIEKLAERMDKMDNCAALVNDLLSSNTFSRFASLTEKAREFKAYLDSFTSFIKQRLQKLLPGIKSANKNEQELFRLIYEWDESPFSLFRLERWLRDHQALEVILTKYRNTYLCSDANARNTDALERKEPAETRVRKLPANESRDADATNRVAPVQESGQTAGTSPLEDPSQGSKKTVDDTNQATSVQNSSKTTESSTFKTIVQEIGKAADASIEETLVLGSVEAAMLNTSTEYLIVYYFHLNSRDKQLCAMADTMKKRELRKHQQSLEDDASLPVYQSASESMLIPARCFIHFAKCNYGDENLKFIFAQDLRECAQMYGRICVLRDGIEIENDYPPPSAPGKPCVNFQQGKIILNWTKSEYGAEHITHYNVLFSKDDWKTKIVESTKVCSMTVNGLVIDTIYRVKVEVWGEYGKTACSKESTFYSSLPTPKKPTARLNFSECTITWEGAQVNEVLFELHIEENGKWKKNVVKTQELSIKIILESGKYRFKVRAFFGEQSSKVGPVSDLLIVQAPTISSQERKKRIMSESVLVPSKKGTYKVELEQWNEMDLEEMLGSYSCRSLFPLRKILCTYEHADTFNQIVDAFFNYMVGVTKDDGFRFTVERDNNPGTVLIGRKEGYCQPISIVLYNGGDKKVKASDDDFSLHITESIKTHISVKDERLIILRPLSTNLDETSSGEGSRERVGEVAGLKTREDVELFQLTDDIDENRRILDRLFQQLIWEIQSRNGLFNKWEQNVMKLNVEFLSNLNRIEILRVEQSVVQNLPDNVDEIDEDEVFQVNVVEYHPVTVPTKDKYEGVKDMIIGVYERVLYYEKTVVLEPRTIRQLRERYGTKLSTSILKEQIQKEIEKIEQVAAFFVKVICGKYCSPINPDKFIRAMINEEKRDHVQGYETRIHIMNRIMHVARGTEDSG